MKRFPSTGALTAGLLTLALLPVSWPSGATAQEVEACTEEATDLVLRPKPNVDTDVGDIFVCNDETTLVVTIKTTYPWCLLKTDLHAATIPEEPAEPDDNIPQDKNGEPNPGEFAYGDQHDCEGTATFPIDLADIDGGVEVGDEVAMAVHAEVDDGERKEGAGVKAPSSTRTRAVPGQCTSPMWWRSPCVAAPALARSS